jgi:shikimate dehydrogenase
MSHPYRLGLLGYPLGHSYSPRLHRAALVRLGLDGEYGLYPVPPGDEAALAALLDELRRGEIDGLNVTIPHKQAVIPLLDDLTPLARAVGAVNTLYTRGFRLVGDNTDVPGFLADLNASLGAVAEPPGPALVLGAGGSARAVAYGLSSVGWQVQIAARRLDQAEALAASLPAPGQSLALIPETLAALTPAPRLIVNTTPLGMSPAVEGCPWPAQVPFPLGAAVYDLVYNPPETALLHRARAANLPAAGGLGMLIAQASLSFACWTETPFPSEVMDDALATDPGRRRQGQWQKS